MDVEEGVQNRKTAEARNEMSLDQGSEDTTRRLSLIYGVDDRPSWGLSFVLGLQHYLTTVGGIFSVPFLLSPALCILPDDPSRGYIMSTIFMVSGIATLFQTIVGVRLPIIQGSSITFIACTLAVLDLPQWRCPPDGDLYAMGEANRTEEWMLRMREIQGAIILSSVFEVLIGYLGLVGLILHYITPLTITPTITLVGLSLVRHGVDMASGNWYISISTVILLALFSQYLRNVDTKIPVYTLVKGWHVIKVKGFQLFPVLLTTVALYIVCCLLTRFDVLGENDPARIDGKMSIVENTEWFRAPYPFQWGWPTFTTSSTLAMLAAVIVGIIESVGDYYACAKICGQSIPPTAAMNRGIGVEGLACVLAGCLGIGTGVTSFSENIGAIGVTRVGSRKVIQCGAIIMFVVAFFGKIGAVFSTIPTPVVGGLLCVLFSVVTAVGLSNLQLVDTSSPRNMFVLGVSMFFGVGIPEWLKLHPGIISTGVLAVDQLFTVLMATPMFVGGFIGFLLDNTISGTPEERGVLAWRQANASNRDASNQSDAYSLPKLRWHRLQKFREELTCLIRRSK
ncbi:hypothetical protein RUM44_002064 [Polyplax serrata]|uniref:Uncharacterized protein n=1 Tax=Polyplax serrata TaxID=468196 RepID=A0ABR1ALU5_POLSC